MKLKKQFIHIGLSSLASNGKTILANEISNYFGIPYKGNFTRSIAKEKGVSLNISQDNSFTSDILQTSLFDAHENFLLKEITNKRSFVTDRTVYDYLTYSYSYFKNNKQINSSTLIKNINYFLNYFEYYDIIFLLPPIRNYTVVNDSDRHLDTQWHLDTWRIMEMINSLYPNEKVYMTKNNDTWEDRRTEVFNIIQETFYDRD